MRNANSRTARAAKAAADKSEAERNASAFPLFAKPYASCGPVTEFGLTKREYFAVHAGGLDLGANPDYVAACLGIALPCKHEIDDDPERAWFLWWRKAEAAWRVAEADALLAALAADK